MIINQVSKCGTTITFLFRILIRYSGIIGAYACRQLYLFVAVCIISFHFFDSDSASPTAQLEWGLRIIRWRSVLELLTLI